MATKVKVTIQLDHDDGNTTKVSFGGTSESGKDSLESADKLETEIATDVVACLRSMGYSSKVAGCVLAKAMLEFWEWGDPEITDEWEAVCQAIEKAVAKDNEP